MSACATASSLALSGCPALTVPVQTSPIPGQTLVTLDNPVFRLMLAAALGLFLGLEREWSEKSAGIRTFSLTSLLAALFTLVESTNPLGGLLLLAGATLVIAQGVLLAVRGLRSEGDGGLSLTTSVSLLVAYGVGVLVALGDILSGVTVAIISSLLLVLKRELHEFAGSLSREELRSTIEFAILAFVVYPLLPEGTVRVLGVQVEPRVAWLMVVTVAAIGIVNYAVVKEYGGRGIAVTGFFGGLASSTAVVGSMLDHVRQRQSAVSYAIAAVLLADAAMAVRNLVIALAFTFPGRTLTGVVIPLVAVVVVAVLVAALTTDWNEQVDIDLESPFSLRNALSFGVVFFLILVGGTLAQNSFGTAGLYVSSFLSGLISSAGSTTTAVLLYRGGSIEGNTAAVAILLATAASVVVKAGLAAAGPRTFARQVALWSAGLVAVTGVVAGAVIVFL